jgi:GntR family transcriptional repressor for pyruvate dehydrogenase complex
VNTHLFGLRRQVRTAPQQIATAIKEQILERSLLPGHRLPPESELAELFGVSRPTVRTALQELCTAQILTSRRGRGGGYYVAELSPERIEDSVSEFVSLSLVVETLSYRQLSEVRSAIELLAAEAAARYRSDEMLARLDAALPRAVDFEGSPRERIVEADLRFHRILAECTGNPLLVSFEGALLAALHRFARRVGVVSTERAVAHLDAVLDAVRERDPRRAREEMARHLEATATYFVSDATRGTY